MTHPQREPRSLHGQTYRVTLRGTNRASPRGALTRYALRRLDPADRRRPLRYRLAVDAAALDLLSDAERAWVIDNERLWQRAHAIVAAHPQLDVSLVFHTLVNFRRTPSERLARGLQRGPVRAR